MIIKSFEIEKIKSKKNNLTLIYGTNQGYKNQVIKELFKELFEGETLRFDENDILNNHEEIISNLMNKSLFDEGKLIIVSRASDKILKFINEILERKIENIKIISEKARDGKLTIDDLQGGTFTISNGGVYGSMLSTPILNPPQSGVLGMHNIVERPIAINGEVKIRPVMYLALSYDHRIIDGKDSVSFLKLLKENLEDPRKLFLDL